MTIVPFTSAMCWRKVLGFYVHLTINKTNVRPVRLRLGVHTGWQTAVDITYADTITTTSHCWVLTCANKGISHFIVFHFTVFCGYWAFYKYKVCVNPVSIKTVGAVFPIAFTYFTSLCHILIIASILQTFLLLLYLLWLSMISGLLCYYYNCLGVTRIALI